MLFKRQSTDVENHTAHILCVADYKGWHDVRILSARKDDDNLTERLLKFKKKGPEFGESSAVPAAAPGTAALAPLTVPALSDSALIIFFFNLFDNILRFTNI
ncbi:hypothetical protein IMSHALPRED_004690 [Imshaugia aleurites]|uniref:Uncharacterized protein n=1 Tax=Imshaugia aleurites TaxID=172621 RepID=A0A8H3F6T8_9LECA|nr:hypothetical protein IMSHALPRED_004690 [Imshaugia aleurites]